ncbi:MAG TPA: ferritin-like domain-containing protein, partial [Polyangiaceae bacterium]|nr:ferritin-like domain-containing protein [Polyangiaceae bacterium]
GGRPMTFGGMETGGSSFACKDATVVGNGFEQCADGAVHRAKAVECASTLPRPPTRAPMPGDQCASDADCTEKPHGYCDVNGQLPTSACRYGCVNDAECPGVPGMYKGMCECGDPIGHCVNATCASDGGCDPGYRCQRYDASRGCQQIVYACQTPEDTCSGDIACGQNGLCDGSTGHFACATFGCAIGRPFLVEGQDRVAPLEQRGDWQAGFALEVAAVSPRVRAAAGQAWARIGQMEHASIAAFARFALQLLQLGAPPDLIERATQAMADETRHAKLAFGVASALCGEALGPGSLDIEHCLSETSLVDVARLVVREGCIGETAAALEAREAAELTAQPELARLLHAVADDEAEHAQLAWRFVHWALERSPRDVAAVVRSELALAEQLALPLPAPASADELAVSVYGVLPERARAELQNEALRDVVLPCMAALLGQSAAIAPENQVLSA